MRLTITTFVPSCPWHTIKYDIITYQVGMFARGRWKIQNGTIQQRSRKK